jgi:hypothetical protein
MPAYFFFLCFNVAYMVVPWWNISTHYHHVVRLARFDLVLQISHTASILLTLFSHLLYLPCLLALQGSIGCGLFYGPLSFLVGFVACVVESILFSLVSTQYPDLPSSSMKARFLIFASLVAVIVVANHG